jgi:hypothetical protein
MKDVRDHLHVIEHNPLAGRKSIHCGCANAVILS